MRPSQIGGEIRQRRQQRGWSLAELARRAGTSAPTVHRYETGWRRFELYTLEKLATALGCRLELTLESRRTPRPEESRADLVGRVRRLFWDRDLRDSDPERFPEWVVQRVLSLGQLEDVCALERFYGREVFLDIVSRVRWDSAKTRTFWMEMLQREGRPCTTRSFPREAAGFWTR